MNTDKIKVSTLSACPPLKRHQRNPSITPTIGFNEYNSRHFSGTISELNPTGLRYKPNCTMNGIMYLKSRYFTFSAVIKRPAPILAIKANKRKNGRKTICQDGE
jgi:hypothetical protein